MMPSAADITITDVPPFEDEWQRLSRYREDSGDNRHVDKGLEDNHDSASHDEECREGPRAHVGYASGPRHKGEDRAEARVPLR